MYPAGPAVAGETARKGSRSRSAASPTSSQSQRVLLRFTSFWQLAFRKAGSPRPLGHGSCPKTSPVEFQNFHTGLLCGSLEKPRKVKRQKGVVIIASKTFAGQKFGSRSLARRACSPKDVQAVAPHRQAAGETSNPDTYCWFGIIIYTDKNISNGSWAPRQKCRRAQPLESMVGSV